MPPHKSTANPFLCRQILTNPRVNRLVVKYLHFAWKKYQWHTCDGSSKVGNGQNTRFWEDIWLGDQPLAKQYPSLYNIVRRRNVLVSDVLTSNPLNIEFRRTLSTDKWEVWLLLLHRLIRVNLTEDPDVFVWNLTTNGVFSVKSMYTDMMNGHTVFLRKYLWKIKVPLKIKIFMWFLYKKSNSHKR
jgi:hypothetical protein